MRKMLVGLLCGLFLTLCFFVLASANFPPYSSSLFQKKFVSVFGYEFVANHIRSIELATNLYNSFPRYEMGRGIFPDYFGGAYIDFESGRFVVLLVEGVATPDVFSESSVMSVVGMGSAGGVIVRGVTYSYRQLTETKEYIRSALMKCDNYAENISSFRIDIVSNRVVVELVVYDDVQVELFENNIFKSSILDFRRCRDV